MDEETYHRAMACLHLIRAELVKIGKIQNNEPVDETSRSTELDDMIERAKEQYANGEYTDL